MDLTQFMHGAPATIVACTNCGTLHRPEGEPANYEADRYDAALLRHVYPRYLEAFERKRASYEPLLRAHAEVLEVGSHLGAFLEAAETWGWKPTGLDIGAETSEFARRRGARVKRCGLSEAFAGRRALDAIFIWNCFEQLGSPRRSLSDARGLLGRHGLIVLRVPNGDYYRKHIEAGSRWLRPLGYNNLLGFPYLHGYNSGSLDLLLRSASFEPVAIFGTSLLSPPYPDLTSSVREEWDRVETRAKRTAAAESPWIEIVGRAVESPRFGGNRS